MSNKNLKVYRIQFITELGQMQFKVKFPCQLKIIWKRSNESAQTKIVPVESGVAKFNQTLKLYVNMYFDTNTNKFIQKKCLYSFLIITQKGEKSAGSITYDLAEFFNKRQYQIQEDFSLQKCPLPGTKIHMKIFYQQSTQQGYDSMSQISTQNMDTSIATVDLSELGGSMVSQKSKQIQPKQQQKKSQSSVTAQRQSSSSAKVLSESNFQFLNQSDLGHQSFIQNKGSSENEKMTENIQALSALTFKINDFVSKASGNIKTQLSTLKHKNTTLQEELRQEQIQKERLEKERNELKLKIVAFQKSNDNEKAENQIKINEYVTKTLQLQKKLEQSQKLCSQLQNSMEEKGQSQASYITQLKANFIENQQKLKEQIKNLNSQILEQKKQRNDVNQELKSLQNQFKLLKEKYQQSEQKKKELQRKQATRERQLTQIRLKFENVYESMVSSLGQIMK